MGEARGRQKAAGENSETSRKKGRGKRKTYTNKQRSCTESSRKSLIFTHTHTHTHTIWNISTFVTTTMESMKKNALLLCVALFAALLLSTGPSSFVTATSDTEDNAKTNRNLDNVMHILSQLGHDISNVATHVVSSLSSSFNKKEEATVVSKADENMLMFYDTYLPDEDEIEVLINDIDESEYDIVSDLMGKQQSYDYDTMIENQLSKMQMPRGNFTVCKECVEKVVYYIGEKVYGKEVEFCKKVMPSPKPSPTAVKFCAFAKENPKASVMLVEMKLHIHPIIMGIKCCHHKGYCSVGMAHEEAHIGKPGMVEEEEKTIEMKLHNVKRGATIIGHKVSLAMDETIAKLSIQKGGNCTQCETMAVHQLEQMFMTSAETVCKYASKIPNPDVEQFCKLVSTKPKEAFKMLLAEMNLSMQQLKQTALMACQQEGLCQASPVSSRFEQTSGVSAYRRVQK